MLSEGPPREPRQCDGPSVLRDVGVVHQQTLAQIELFANNKDGKYKKEVYVLPKSLDEKVAPLAPRQDRREADDAAQGTQADYIGVKQEGPFKADHYRY